MFRDELQTTRAIRILLAPMRLDDLWTDEGPTARAVELLEQNGGAFSSGERTMILAAWAFWNDRASPLRFDALLGLDDANIEALCSLLVVAGRGPEAIEDWIAHPESRRYRKTA